MAGGGEEYVWVRLCVFIATASRATVSSGKLPAKAIAPQTLLHTAH